MASNRGAGRLLRRYGPIVVVLAIVAAIVLIAGGGGDDDDDGEIVAGNGQTGDDLPRTFQEAEVDGDADEIDWGPGCDTESGRLMIPINNRPPCIEPFDETEGNGGATSRGVTADEIVVVVYQGQPDPLQSAIVSQEGGSIEPADVNRTVINYLRMFEDVVETYGRTLRIETIEATGGPADATAAQADARRVIELAPFAAVGGPTQTDAYWRELTDAEIVCVGLCSLATPWDLVEENAPYLWPGGHAPEQADIHLAEFLGKQLVGKPAEFAGDPALQSTERVFGWVQAERSTGEFAPRNDAFDQMFEQEYGGEIATRSTYLFQSPATGDEVAGTIISRMKEEGVTSIVLSTDPFVPKQLTEEATKQNYFPEWIIGPTVLVDTTFFGRTYDQQQWAQAFGIGLPSARADNELSDSWFVHEWYYGEPPPVNTQGVVFPGTRNLMLGIHLAGPNLTPETFRQGMFRYPPEPSGLTYSHQSWGEDVWGRADYNGTDDATVIWWDPDVAGESEVGAEGPGLLRYVDGGRRFLPGEWPTEPIPLFDEEGSVTIYEELPESDRVPDYPPWPGSPAAGGAGG